MEEDVENARAAGFSAHLTKPVSYEELRAALDRIAPGGS
jgi:CheY-like chemotaxis protein